MTSHAIVSKNSTKKRGHKKKEPYLVTAWKDKHDYCIPIGCFCLNCQTINLTNRCHYCICFYVKHINKYQNWIFLARREERKAATRSFTPNYCPYLDNESVEPTNTLPERIGKNPLTNCDKARLLI